MISIGTALIRTLPDKTGTSFAASNEHLYKISKGVAMQVQEIISANPACCAPDASVKEGSNDGRARLRRNSCVADGEGKPVGVITDRDIVCRIVADGKGTHASLREAMSAPVLTTVTSDTDVECCRMMEENQVRRVPVVDENGVCCGMVSQADVALEASEQVVGELARDVSRASAEESRASGQCC